MRRPNSEILKINQELKRIADKHKGILNPEDVIKEAEDKESILHDEFTWDDSVASHQWRLEEARYLIRGSVVFTDIQGEKKEIRAFVSLTTDRKEGGYRELTTVLSHEEYRRQLLLDALTELETFQKKYQELKELAEIFFSIKRIVGKVKVEKKEKTKTQQKKKIAVPAV